jgi:hypothetical protein
MAIKIYDINSVHDIQGNEYLITPLKIRYMHDFMEKFETVHTAKNNEASIDILLECALISMSQFAPGVFNDIEELSLAFDIKTLYKIIEYSADIKVAKNDEKQSSIKSAEGSTWATMDIARLESEVFLTGIWKNFEELENSISMPELLAILSTKRELDYEAKKFNAALQGVDLDEQTGKSNAWEDLKARVFSKGQTKDSNDILSLQGQNAQTAGFGIGLGLDYEKIDS